MVISGLALVIVAIVVCLVNPIRVALKLNLKHKIIIIAISALNFIFPLISALIAYILIILDLKQENLLDTNNPELKNRNIVSVVFYVVEGLILFLPAITIRESAMGIEVKCNLSIFNFVGVGSKTLDVNGMQIDIMEYFVSSRVAEAMFAMGFITLTAVAIGIIMNLLVKSPEITFFFNGVLQIVYIGIALIFAAMCQDSKMVNKIGRAHV